MSQQNVEVVRRMFDAFNRGDVETVVAAFDEGCRLHEPPEMPDTPAEGFRGHEGIRELWSLWRTDVEDFWIETDEIRDLRDERVLHLAHMRFRGRASGITVESQLALVATLRDGKIVRSDDYLSHDEALKAVGLEE